MKSLTDPNNPAFWLGELVGSGRGDQCHVVDPQNLAEAERRTLQPCDWPPSRTGLVARVALLAPPACRVALRRVVTVSHGLERDRLGG